jgi:hypothetical protein
VWLWLCVVCVVQSPLIITFDDAIFLDKHSWSLIAKLVTSVDNLLVVLASRPINKSYLAAFTSIPPEFASLTADKQRSTVHVMGARSAKLIDHIACQTVGPGIKELPEAFASLIADRAQGSPLVVKEMVQALKKEGLVSIGYVLSRSRFISLDLCFSSLPLSPSFSFCAFETVV